ncbi:MAG: nucleotidyltransferase domain-containing protein [Thermus sp.]
MTRVFTFDPEARRAELERATAWLAERPEVLAVVLFGSLARGEATAMSDADLLVLLEGSPLPFPERLVLYRPQGIRRVEVFPYTWEEAVRGLWEGHGLVHAALREGVPLFEREGAWARLKGLASSSP